MSERNITVTAYGIEILSGVLYSLNFNVQNSCSFNEYNLFQAIEGYLV